MEFFILEVLDCLKLLKYSVFIFDEFVRFITKAIETVYFIKYYKRGNLTN